MRSIPAPIRESMYTNSNVMARAWVQYFQQAVDDAINNLINNIYINQDPITVTGNATLTSDYCVVTCNSATALALTLPASDTMTNKFFIIYNNGGVGIRCAAKTVVLFGNRCSTNTGGDFVFTHYPYGMRSDDNFAADGVYPLQYSGTWDPGSIAAGSFESKSVTVTGVALADGDMVTATFPMRVSSSAQTGMSISASVTASNTVVVTIVNSNSGAIDLDSGTLIVKATKGLNPVL